jgi:hypothetical protein
VRRGYETRDVAFKPVLWAGFGLIAIVVAFFVLMWVLYVHLLDREARSSAPAHRLAAEQARTEPPYPRLQSDPVDDWLNFQAENQRILSTYGWVDRPAGIVRIPIEKAMELALERGFPVRKIDGLRGTPDPRFEAYVRERERAESQREDPAPARKRRQHRKRTRGGR